MAGSASELPDGSGPLLLDLIGFWPTRPDLAPDGGEYSRMTQSLDRFLPAAGNGARRRLIQKPIRATTVLGPAFIAAIAYVDPGNFATNFQGGATTGYRLVWVVVTANLMAMPIQYMSAKLGIVTGRSLPELCRETLSKPMSLAMWLQAELVAMATDLAEFIGAAIGLKLLFGMPLPLAGACTAVMAFIILSLQRRGHRPFEVAVAALLMFIAAGFLYLVFQVPPSPSQLAGGLIPDMQGQETLVLVAGIIGATVMPHAIYLHSGLTSRRSRPRTQAETITLLRFERLDIVLAMTIAGLVNLSMLAFAAEVFHGSGAGSVTLPGIHAELRQLVGGGAALVFACALLASGISSSSVGTAAGQVIMDGFLGVSLPLWIRRLVTMAPALLLLGSGIDATKALVLSQVSLSFGIPFALVALLVVTSRRQIMGDHVNRRPMIALLSGITGVLIILNVVLLGQQVIG